MLPIQASENIYGREFIRVNESLVLLREVNPNTPADNEFSAVLDGLRIPNLELSQNAAGEWHIFLDRRFGFIFAATPDDLFQILLLVANAMAVAAGFSCFGTHSRVINPYRKYPAPGEPDQPIAE